VAPAFAPVEFGIADKLLIRAIAEAVEKKDSEVLTLFKKLGDLGTAAEALKKGKGESEKGKAVTVSEVFEKLREVALSSGAGSQEKKLQLLSDLIAKVDPLSARYIVRIPLNKLRLGFSDMTILDGLSWMIAGDKSARKQIEKAYNVRPDLGTLACLVKEKGVAGLAHIKPKPNTPILMAKANRLSSAADIFVKIGKCAIEFKYDGLRLQVHYVRGKGKAERGKPEIKMFSRNLEDVTPMFPDIAEAVKKQIEVDEVIFEGEVVAYNPKTGVHVPFQETMQRKRKYDIAQKVAEIPVKLYCFELLYLDGVDYLYKPYIERKKALKQIIHGRDTIIYAQEEVTKEEAAIDRMFDESVRLHFEGIMAKKLDGVYEAGVRGWNWIKFKKAMSKKLADTVDCVVMGYTLGEGKRTSFGMGQFLAGVYDPKTDRFLSITKVGTGLTDEQFKEFVQRVKKLKISEKPAEYSVDKLLEPDVWLKPELVVELGSDEITRSQVHSAGRIMGPSKSGTAEEVKTPGYALRFPRLVRFRDDKTSTDATTVIEVADLFAQQGKKHK
jgi:DNA ligase-1